MSNSKPAHSTQPAPHSPHQGLEQAIETLNRVPHRIGNLIARVRGEEHIEAPLRDDMDVPLTHVLATGEDRLRAHIDACTQLIDELESTLFK